MKKIIYLLMTLILISSVVALESYPEDFFDDGVFDAKIVVGEKAHTMDVTSAVELIPGLQPLSEERIKGSMLDSDVTDYTFQKYGIISIGCENTVTQKITKACETFEEGYGYIMLFESPLGKPWLVIAGKEIEDTNKAAKVLGKYEEYDLEESYVKVSGSSEPFNVESFEYEEPEEQEELTEEPEIEEYIPDPIIYEEIEEPEERDYNSAEKLQQELEEELKEIEEKNKSKPVVEEPEFMVDESLPVHKQAWERFKHWLSWFFR